MNRFKSTMKYALMFSIILQMVAAYQTFADPLDFETKEVVKEKLRSRIEAAVSGLPSMLIGNESVKTTKALTSFYVQRLFEPVWIGERGVLPETHRMIGSILDADTEGLNSKDYHVEKIVSIVETISQNNSSGKKLNADRQY